MRVRYYHIKFYEQELKDAKNYEKKFTVRKTTYTRTIITPNSRCIFNQNGDGDDKTLILINMVRKDASDYMKKNGLSVHYDDKIDFFNLLIKEEKMISAVKKGEVLCKVDIKEAYWQLALKENIITQKTDDRFKQLFSGHIASEAKGARLKALGSLATTTIEQDWENGKMVDERLIVEQTKPIYMMICAGIDRLMKDLGQSVPGCRYYYWDCMFVSSLHKEEVVSYLLNQGYASEYEETSTEYHKVGENGYLVCKTGDGCKSYMTRKENAGLLELAYKKDGNN